MRRKAPSENIQAREGQYGHLVWNEYVPAEQKSGAVLLGRMVALYDHIQGNLSMLAVYADPDNRGIALARIGKWLDEQNKRTRQAYSTICVDCSGMGRNEVLTDDFDMDLFTTWYDIEKNALAANDLIKRVLRKVWGGDVSALLNDLSIPGPVFQGWNTWLHLMGRDVTTCMQAAFIQMMRTPDGYLLMAGDDWDSRGLPEKFEDYADVREAFVSAWKNKEDELLALPKEERSAIWEM